MRQIFLIISLIFSTTFLLAQEASEKKYLVYLKDGSFLKGRVAELENNQIEVFIEAEHTLLISKKWVRSIEPLRDKYFFLENGLSYKNQHYFNAVTIEAFVSPTTNSLGLHTTNAFFINPTMATGIGIGIDLFSGPNNNYTTYAFIPISAHFRHYPFDQKVSPFYALDLGWGIPVAVDSNPFYNVYNGGIMAKIAFGLRFASRKKTNFVLETGYRFQKTFAEYDLVNYQNGSIIRVREDILFKRLTLGLGYIF